MGIDDTFFDFAMEADLSPSVLGKYIRENPDIAVELTDLFHELVMGDLAIAIGLSGRLADIDHVSVAWNRSLT